MSEIDIKNADDLLALAEFINHFNIHYRLLLQRYARFIEINHIHNKDIDVITYLDIIVVQLRAMCIENSDRKKNYTAQTLLRNVGEVALADKLDAMLDEEFLIDTTGFTIRKALKTLADKFICHYDNFDGVKNGGWALAVIIEKQLRNPYSKKNLEYIMKTVMDCIGEGLTLEIRM